MLNKNLNIITIFIPIFFTFIYLFLIAEDRFISHSTFTLKSESESGVGIDLGFLGAPTSSKQDQMIIKNYIVSQDMMDKVIKKFGVEKALSNSARDPLWKITKADSSIKKIKRYTDIVTVIYDDESGVTNIKVENFDPIVASEINEFILSESINFVNDFSNSLSNNFIQFAEKDLEKSKTRLNENMDRLQKFQNDSSLISPESEEELILSQLTNLELTLSQEEVKYEELTGYMQTTSPQIKSLQRRIDNLKLQIRNLKEQISSENKFSLNDKYRQYIEIKGDLEFSQATYETSLKTLEAARIKAMQSQKHIMTISNPSIQDEAELPKRFFDFATYLIIILLSNLTIRLIVKIFKEYE